MPQAAAFRRLLPHSHLTDDFSQKDVFFMQRTLIKREEQAAHSVLAVGNCPYVCLYLVVGRRLSLLSRDLVLSLTDGSFRCFRRRFFQQFLFFSLFCFEGQVLLILATGGLFRGFQRLLLSSCRRRKHALLVTACILTKGAGTHLHVKTWRWPGGRCDGCGG